MSTTGSCHSVAACGNPQRLAWLQVIALAALLASPLSNAFAQDAATETPAASAQTDAPPSETPAADAAPAEVPAAESADNDAEATTETAPAATAATEAAADEAVATDATQTPPSQAADAVAQSLEAPAGDFNMRPVYYGLIIVGLFVIPMIIGTMLASWLNMPDYGWKISLVLGTLAASIVIVSLGQFKFGPDLAGGITLIYELAEKPAEDPEGENEGQKLKFQEMIDILKRRIDPTGTREVTIREYGPAIEIIIPNTGDDALDYIKRRITEMGQLEFRITADPTQPNPQEREIIRLAQELPMAQTDVVVGGRVVAEWIAYKPEEFGTVESDDGRNIVKRMSGTTPQALVLIDPQAVSVTGDYLSAVKKSIDPESGGPEVAFRFNSQGARRFQQLTSKNKPNAATGARRYLGIVLDKRLLSAPSIESTISTEGRISGRSMGEEEVDYIVSILQEGKLPLELEKEPISEEIISPTLGVQTIESGKRAILISGIAIFVFMLVYYRFAGLVACIALAFNILLVVAVMVLIRAAFTLPGLAGLVLTMGMSVDANILIFERMREEYRSGAALRMVIRNGFDRAMSAIIDSNITTIISGIALYLFATDQVKGFAVTLILGILTSMYTAIFVSRLIFEISERQGWVKKLTMLKILSNPNYDFLSKRWAAISASLILIGIGLVAVYGRGWSLLDIDFTGGSSVTFVLSPDEKMTITDVRSELEETDLATRNLLVVERGTSGTRFSVDTSEQSVDNVKQVLLDTFDDKLQMYTVEVGEVTPFTEGTFTGMQASVKVNDGPGFEADDGISHDALMELVNGAIEAEGLNGIIAAADSPAYSAGSSTRVKDWNLRLGGADQTTARQILSHLETDVEQMAMFPQANKIGGRVSANMQIDALKALFISLLGMIVYLWVRFEKLIYGLAAAAALVHDVLITIGMIAISKYIVDAVPGFASALQIDSFQIGLTIVAALLTIIGYSVNDTIVTFDRLREIKGKNPKLRPDMINGAVNQCLSRTLLTALTVFLSVVILYFWGGDGIHGFAFAFLIGTVAGTYSTVYIAAPVLLWLSGESAELTSSPAK